MNYVYTEENRLEQPHKYMYTAFGGTAFLQAYAADRRAAIAADVAAASSAEESIDANLLRALQGKDIGAAVDALGAATRGLEDATIDAPPATVALLLALAARRALGLKIRDLDRAWVSRLAQRFEVTKKLYAGYAPGFRKGILPRDEVRPYWLLALVLSLYGAHDGRLSLLSTLLKVDDLLCSLPAAQREGAIPSGGLAYILRQELATVRALAAKVEVDDGAL